MRNCLFTLALLGLVAASARADVLILKDGAVKEGRVKSTKTGYEITIDGQKLAFDKDQVKRWIKSPTEILREADADRLYREAEKIYLAAIEINDQKLADDELQKGYPLAVKARTAYVDAAEYFPSWTSPMVKKVILLMKKYRAHMGSQMAYEPPPSKKETPAPKPEPKIVKVKPKPEPKPEPVKISPLGDALAILVDPAKRSDAKERERALKLFRQIWLAGKDGSDVAAAGHLFLAKSEAEWGLKPGEPAAAALQDFFKSMGAKNLEELPEKETVAALKTLSAKTKEVGGRFMDGAGEPLALFLRAVSSAHIARAKGKPDAGLEASLGELGFKKSEFGAIWGTTEGLALTDYRNWVASKDYELGFIEFRSDYKTTRDFSVRYARGLLALFKALRRNDQYSRAAVEFELLARSAKGAERSHVLALAKSIRTHAPCRVCAGTHKINCSACKGKMKVTLQCNGCGGSGKINSLRGIVKCRHCKGRGMYRNVDCPKCKEGKKSTGKTECKARYCKKPVPAPTFETFAEAYECSLCMGKGTFLKHVALTCSQCKGVGLVLRPSNDPSKTISAQDAK